MLFDYVKGIVFVVIFITLIFFFGKSIKKSADFSENLIYGYVLYTLMQFVGGFLAQQLRLPWIIYQCYMIILLLLIVIYSVYSQKGNLKKVSLYKHFKDHWLIYILVMVLISLAIFNIDYQWNGNNTDDGYYLYKIKMAPYIDNYVDYNYATGFAAPSTIVRNLNTFEIEAAFYSQLLGIEASIYAKVFLAMINYFLVLNVIYWFYKKVYKTPNGKLKFIIPLVLILFFGIYEEVINGHRFLFMTDAWQFNSAMWFGSTLVRTIGFFLLITPFIDKKKYEIKDILFFGITCLALLSKSSQTLPVAFLSFFSLGVVYILENFYRKKSFKAMVILCIGLVFLLLLVPLPAFMESRSISVFNILRSNSRSIILWPSIILCGISFLYDSESIRKWNICLIIIGALIFIPYLNHAFILLSIYEFVANRVATLYFFTIVMTASLYGYLLISKVIYNQKIIYIVYAALACLLIAYPLNYIQKRFGVENAIKILSNNSRFIPESTIQISEILQKEAESKNTPVYVLSPMWFKNYNIPHSLATSLRYNAKDVYSIGTCARYPDIYNNLPYVNYTEEDQLIFDEFNSRVDTGLENMKYLLDKYPINYVIVTYDDAAKSLEELGFKLLYKLPLDNTYTYSIMHRDI